MSNLELTHQVEALIEEVNQTHRYSTSRIYSLYNQAFGKSEVPQSCASCLMRRVKELQAWLITAKETQTQEDETVVEEAKTVETETAQPESKPKRKRKNGSAKA